MQENIISTNKKWSIRDIPKSKLVNEAPMITKTKKKYMRVYYTIGKTKKNEQIYSIKYSFSWENKTTPNKFFSLSHLVRCV